MKFLDYKDTYYFGEFGYFNLEILGGLEHYFRAFPRAKLDVHTFQDYGRILKHLYPKNVNFTFHPHNIPWRSTHQSELDRFFENRYQINLCLLTQNPKLNDHVKTFFINRAIRMFYMSSPLQFGQKVPEKIVCIGPRFRNTISDQKNLTHQDWTGVIGKVRNKNKNIKIVLLGKSEEMLHLKCSNSIAPTDIFEQIRYLNQCEYAIFPDSGLAEFSLNCGCKKVIVIRKVPETCVDSRGWIKPLLHGFNPFEANVKDLMANHLGWLKELSDIINQI